MRVFLPANKYNFVLASQCRKFKQLTQTFARILSLSRRSEIGRFVDGASGIGLVFMAWMVGVYLPVNKYNFVRASQCRKFKQFTQIFACILSSSRCSEIGRFVVGASGIGLVFMAWIVGVYLPANKYNFVRASQCRKLRQLLTRIVAR